MLNFQIRFIILVDKLKQHITFNYFYMKKLVLLICILTASTYTVFGQAEGSVVSATARGGVATTMVTDYQSIGINPANLGLRGKYETKHVTFGLLETNASGFVQGASLSQIKNLFLSNDSLTSSQRSQGASLFKGSTVSANADVMLFGLSIQSDKLGGLAFSVNDVVRTYAGISQNFSNFIFSGASSTQYFDSLKLGDGTKVANDPSQYSNYYNNHQGITQGITSQPFSLGHIISGSNFKAQYNRTFNAAYSREVFRNEVFTLSAGIGVKYVMSYYYMNISADNGVLKGNIANNPAFSSFSPNLSSPGKVNGGNVISPVGQGYGIDLGITGTILDILKVGVSVVNIGAITYNKNTYQVKDTTITTMNYSPSTADGLNQTIFWKKSNSFTVQMPTMFRFGTSISLLEKKIEVGTDIVVPLNHEAGNINKAIYAIGGDAYVTRWFKVSTGTSIGGNYANSIYYYRPHVCIPLGITFIAGENGGWEVGFSTRDIVSLINTNTKSPLYSMGMCVFRFRL
jgi:hypothetical protein